MSDRQQTIVIAGERIIYTIRRSRRAKHVLLHVDVEGQVEVVIPWRVGWADGEKFVKDKEEWIRRHLRKNHQQRRRLSFTDGSSLPFLEETLQLRLQREATRRRPSIVRHGMVVTVSLPPQTSARRVLAAWYRRQAHAYFEPLADSFARQLGVVVERVVVGNHKTQWGSCSAGGRLSFNWRLLLGPQWVAEYVVAHEVAHLVQHNHSPAYWATVARVYPEYKKARRWLREHPGYLVW